jgi:hypothetical protein
MFTKRSSAVANNKERIVGDYDWLGARLRVGVPTPHWFARLDDLLGVKVLNPSATSDVGEITALSERAIRSFADEVRFRNLNDLLIWLALTATDVLSEKRGAFLLHAACFVLHGQAVLVFGPPFSGKSTLTAMALARGMEILGDDVIHLAPETGLAEAVPRPLKRRIDRTEMEANLGDPLAVGTPLYGALDGEACVLRPRAVPSIWPPSRRLPVRASIFLRRHDGPGLHIYQPERFQALAWLLEWARDWSTPPLACAHRSARQLLAQRHLAISVGDGEQEAALDAILDAAQ